MRTGGDRGGPDLPQQATERDPVKRTIHTNAVPAAAAALKESAAATPSSPNSTSAATDATVATRAAMSSRSATSGRPTDLATCSASEMKAQPAVNANIQVSASPPSRQRLAEEHDDSRLAKRKEDHADGEGDDAQPANRAHERVLEARLVVRDPCEGREHDVRNARDESEERALGDPERVLELTERCSAEKATDEDRSRPPP